MSTGVSTRQKLICKFDDIDGLLKDLLDKVNKKCKVEDFQHLIVLLLEKDKEVKSTLKDVEEQLRIQKKIDQLRSDCLSSDVQIQSCQKQLQQSELVLSTALYYCRQKLDSMVCAVKNPVDVEELIKFSHRISHTYGVISPDNWIQGDPRRPYPNKEEIRSGYLGFLDDFGNFRPEISDAFSQAISSFVDVNTFSSGNTPSQTQLGPVGQMHTPSSGHHDNQSLRALTPSNSENAVAQSSSISLPGVNMVSSPSIPNNLSAPCGYGSADNTTGSEKIGHNLNSSTSRHPTSLAPILTGHVATTRPVGTQPSLPRIHSMSQPFSRMPSRTSDVNIPGSMADARTHTSMFNRNSTQNLNPAQIGLFAESQKHTHKKKNPQIPASNSDSLERFQSSSSLDPSAEDFKSRTDNFNF